MLEPLSAKDLDAERAVLGAMLLGREAVEKALAVLQEGHFSLNAHALIFAAMRRIWERHEGEIDLIATASELEAQSKCPEPVTRQYLASLLDATAGPAFLDRYTEPVLRCHFQRLLARAGERLREIAASPDLSRGEMASQADGAVQDVTRQAATGARIRGIGDVVVGLARTLAERDRQPRGVTGVPFGIAELDNRTNGWQAGELTVIAALPGGGKTAFGCQAALHAAEQGYPVLFFSLEMSEEQIAARMAANVARVDGLRMQRGLLRGEEIARRDAALDHIAGLPIRIDECSEVSPAYILAACRSEEEPAGLVIVDYAGLMDANSKRDSEIERTSEVMRGLKRIAKSLQVPVMVMSQFRKGVAGERRGPDLDDLMSSRAVSADPACVAFLRPAAKEEELPAGVEPDFTRPVPIFADVKKNRHGGAGRVALMWTPAYVRFDRVDRYGGGR